MKWGRRKSSSPSPSISKPSLFSSWLSKLKKMASTNDPAPEPEPEAGHGHGHGLVRLNGGKEEKGRSSWSSMGSTANGAPGEGGGRFCGDGDGIGGLRSSFKVSVKVKELPEEKEIEIKTPRKGSVKEMRFRSNHRRVLEERLSKLEEEEEEEARSTKTVHKHVLNMEPNSVSEQRLSNGQQKLKELKLKAERHRKSYYITRELQGRGGAGAKSSSKIRVYSPRTPTKSEICKIRALEDLKRARTRARKKTTVLESLAVVKCSVDPEKDFRDSMMEMILEEGIGKPEELEELLACYLTLNADEYHDLIIRVFRQVWLELNEACARSEIIHEEECCYV